MDPETPQVQKEITEAPSAPVAASQKRTQVAIIGGAVLLLALLVTAIVLMANTPAPPPLSAISPLSSSPLKPFSSGWRCWC